MEGDVECREAAVLRGAVKTEQSSHGEASRLPIQVITDQQCYLFSLSCGE